MLRHPPEILITTPESLNLLLSSSGGRSILTGISTVILDEIHAVYGTKRGVYLITAVDRLVRLSGEFQRIVLSATLRPLGTGGRVCGRIPQWRETPETRDFRYTPAPDFHCPVRSEEKVRPPCGLPEEPEARGPGIPYGTRWSRS